jgi:soluble lytic murein transglycosylase-like protein
MRRKLFVAGCTLATVAISLGLDVRAADRPVFCGTKPWQSIVRQASQRFDLPRAWLNAVIRSESAGCATMNGKPIISAAGAMGLMQLMPSTWLEYRARLQLGDDPFQAHDNIFAGAAYLHDLYQRYGEEGFLAAYQAGPERYEEFVRDARPLPRVTVKYVARVERAIERIDASASPLSSPAAPAASSLFVVLTSMPSNAGRAMKPKLDTRLFVPLSRGGGSTPVSGK